MKKNNRLDRTGTHRGPFEKNKKKIYLTQTHCGICGHEVDKSLKYPHPMSKCIDHKIPIDKGGHPSDIENLQLAHLSCNRQKSNKLYDDVKSKEKKTVSNRNLPHSRDWICYTSK